MRFLNTTATASRNTLLLIHGLDGSPQGHWQDWLAHRAAELGHDVHFPELPSKENPNLLYWLSLLHLEAVAAGPQATLVAHSLGAYLWLHYASLEGAQPLERVLLVAPPGKDEVIASGRVRDLPDIQLNAERIRAAAKTTLVVGTSADPYNRKGARASYAKPLGLPYLELDASAGHINPASGFDSWPFALDWATGNKPSPRQRPFQRKPRTASVRHSATRTRFKHEEELQQAI